MSAWRTGPTQSSAFEAPRIDRGVLVLISVCLPSPQFALSTFLAGTGSFLAQRNQSCFSCAGCHSSRCSLQIIHSRGFDSAEALAPAGVRSDPSTCRRLLSCRRKRSFHQLQLTCGSTPLIAHSVLWARGSGFAFNAFHQSITLKLNDHDVRSSSSSADRVHRECRP